MIYRRNRGLSPTRELNDITRGVKSRILDTDASLVGHARRWWIGRGVLLASQKVCQTIWLAGLVYAFLGLPVLGRVLNFVRFVHRFPVFKIFQGLVVGMLQDVAILLQASTCICLVKILFGLDILTPQGLNYTRNHFYSGFLRDRTGSTRFLPVYMPVLATEYDLRDDSIEALVSGVGTNHRTLLSLGAAANRPAFVARIRRGLHTLVIVTLLLLILITATIASVADFCLQVTMHPRLNRAFVTIFFNYMKQFTASLTDEEVMTRTVIGSWVVYVVLMTALTCGIYTGKLPLASDFLRLSDALCCCVGRPFVTRKDSMGSSGTYAPNLFASNWPYVDKPTRLQRRNSTGCSQMSSGSSHGSSGGHAAAVVPGPCTFGYGLHTKSSPLMLLSRCLVASLLATGIALSASVFLNGKGGVDMKLMNNAMFALQAEQFFYHATAIHREEINCTAASSALRSTLGISEKYEVAHLGNDDHCALLWRKTTAYEGETLFRVNLNESHSHSTELKAMENDLTEAIDTKDTARTPNIIVINMESWRHLDIGVLGGAAKKTLSGKTATPHFDELAKTGVLYTKHYTPCVQTSRTLLTTLFGMLPSCTETTALKEYSTTLKVRGLPHFLKQRGYFNLFWSAVDLTWEYWDKFLLENGFDKLVDDLKIRTMLHETRNYKNSPDDHFSWGMHDDLSFEMLLYAIESAHNASKNAPATVLNGTTNILFSHETDFVNKTAVKGRHDHGASSNVQNSSTMRVDPTKVALSGWEGLQSPFFIDMYSITSHNPWALPKFYDVPDLSELYTHSNQKYLDSLYFSDEMLGTFIAALRSKGLMKNTLVIIEGDHGYGRLEHDNNPSSAESGVWDEASRVPFLLLADDILREEDKGTVVNQLTMQSDLMATIADILGVTPEQPLYQHGYGHSMMRRRGHSEAGANEAGKGKKVAVNAKANSAQMENLQERRVVLCNPFDGMSKGVRTEELKYVFHPDGSFNVFELANDTGEKKSLQTGFDVEEMEDGIRDVFEYVTKVVDLNQFLFEANRFVTILPPAVISAFDDVDALEREVKGSQANNLTIDDEMGHAT
ncbi:hypothetical protein CCR75_007309 [Bremia lactucae]|uniref:Sulfatase N-terminal domain-containing protein n=1 Tax=Bremia lactucae TaxID=4779 RepID=A0A976FHW0_BRELC|nr:hypothetical protein CCR75_007309 [Bremia lactucae]